MRNPVLATVAVAAMTLSAGAAEAGSKCRDFTRTIDKRGYVEVQRGVECWTWNGWQTVSYDVDRYYSRHADTFYYGGGNGYSSGTFLNVNLGKPRTVIVKENNRHQHWNGRGRGHGHDRHDDRRGRH